MSTEICRRLGDGLMNRVRPAADVVYEMARDFVEATERVAGALK